MGFIAQKQRDVLVMVLLAVLALATFWPILSNDFIRYDDSQYVVDNPRVLNGVTWPGIIWAFKTGHASNWHPVTWLSHMLDVQLFGLKPHWHHCTSLLLHIANTLLLFHLFRRITGKEWPSAFVAAMFAVHPLHVESIAWVSERKDVLSTFFFLLTLLAYCRYAQDQRPETGVPGDDKRVVEAGGNESSKSKVQGSKSPSDLPSSILNSIQCRAYLLALAFLALGLMSKPMLVSVPFLLLLLDYWPLQRFKPGSQREWFKLNVWLLWEKIPFLLLAVVSSVVTFAVQQKSHSVLGELPLTLRVTNAVVSYVRYLGKTVWPENLSIFYPHPNTRYFVSPAESIYPRSEQWPYWVVMVAFLFLLTATYLVILRRRQQPWLLTGWFWYLGTLVPVIGIIQVGLQAMADRYTYIPLIGIFVIIAWGGSELSWALPKATAAKGRGARQGILAAGAALAIGACVMATHKQTGYWRNNFAVFEHALEVTPRNSVAEFNIGSELVARKEFEQGEAHLRAALAADPYNEDAYAALGYLFESQGKVDQALEQFEKAVRLRPWDDLSRCHIAALLEGRGQRDEAIAQYESALQFNPDNVLAHYRLGAALCERGDLQPGARHFEAALRLRANYPDALLYLSDVRLKQGKLIEAEIPLRELVRLYPTNSELRINLGSLLWQRGQDEAALAQYREAVRLNPAEPMGHFNMGTVLAAEGRLSESSTHFAEALRLRPDYSEARVELGRVLSKQRRYSEAQAVLEGGIQLWPTNAVFHRELGNVLLLEGRTNDANASFTNAFRLDPEQGGSK